MLLFKKHGRRAGASGDLPAYQSCGYTDPAYGGYTPEFGPFDYFFPETPDVPDTAHMTAHLDALANAMVERDPEDCDNSAIPPVFTYLGQFIDHDVTANTDRETDFSKIDVDRVVPAERAAVTVNLANLRMGSLNLDSLYGGAVAQGPVATKLAQALRFPQDPAKLWIGTLFDSGLGSVPLPDDIAADLLRVERLLRGAAPVVTEDELRSLPDPMREMFVRDDGSIRIQRAILGDSRNDENLAIAQLHLAFARFHNQVVDEANRFVPDTHDREAVFTWARRMVTWHYQWLVLNAYLPTVCDPETVRSVLSEGAPVYRAFLDRIGQPGPDLMPMPLEFSVSAFRFGHSMIRAEYDWSRFFGRAEGPRDPFLDRASLELLFQFTGGAARPMPLPDDTSAPRLPSHWGIEWERFALPVTNAMPDRAARKIDTNLALPLSDMENEGDPGVLRVLAKRNLRRGHRLNIPTAQASIEALGVQCGIHVPVLAPDEVASGPTGAAVRAGGFDVATPLWFYVLKEAEVLGDGEHLGPLGSRLVAETLAGLVIHDPNSFWAGDGSGPEGRWCPADGVTPDGHVVDSVPGLLRAAGVL